MKLTVAWFSFLSLSAMAASLVAQAQAPTAAARDVPAPAEGVLAPRAAPGLQQAQESRYAAARMAHAEALHEAAAAERIATVILLQEEQIAKAIRVHEGFGAATRDVHRKVLAEIQRLQEEELIRAFATDEGTRERLRAALDAAPPAERPGLAERIRDRLRGLLGSREEPSQRSLEGRVLEIERRLGLGDSGLIAELHELAPPPAPALLPLLALPPTAGPSDRELAAGLADVFAQGPIADAHDDPPPSGALDEVSDLVRELRLEIEGLRSSLKELRAEVRALPPRSELR